MRHDYAYIAFTDQGETLAKRLSSVLGGTVSRGGEHGTIAEWTGAAMKENRAIVFVGAAGIAVRAIAPYLRGKHRDPAVVVMDEQGKYAIPILSGHLGGANDLARKLAGITCGEAIITTATDLNGRFAVDLWAKRQNLVPLQIGRMKEVSMKALRGIPIRVCCRWAIAGVPPERIVLCTDRTTLEKGDVLVDYRSSSEASLQLVPRILTLGIGCRRGVRSEQLEEGFVSFCRERDILAQAIRSAASIDLKRDEAGISAFCEAHGWTIRYDTAEDLAHVEGSFSASAYVKEKVGVDNVCERSAVLESCGKIIEKKYACGGITFALAEGACAIDWET